MQDSYHQIKRYLSLSFLSVFVFYSQAQTDFSFDNISQIGLPVVSITTVNGEEPTCDYVDAPEGSFGQSITNATKVPCRIVITKGNDVIYDSGDYQKNTSGATIKINGNTSAYHDNKPYKIKLQVKEDLLFRENEKYKDKDWRLLKDARTLNTMIGLKMNELIGMSWTPAYQPCNVFINNDYRGCYLLIESVKRNPDCRLNIKKSGFIIERDPYWWNENTYFETNYFSPYNYYRWTWKYPEEEDVTEELKESIQTYINQVEKSIETGKYEQYIDINSFVSWLLAHDMMGTYDSGGSNLYIMKYDDNSSSLFQMGNLWDFDTIFKVEKGSFSRIHSSITDFYFLSLLNNSNKTFVNAYKKRWEEIKDIVPQQIINYIKTFAESEEGKALQLSREYYTKRWNKPLTTVNEDVTQMIEWFNEHVPLLNIAIQEIDCETSIKQYTMHHISNTTYNLLGNKIIIPYKGIYIKNGKKYIAK
jgi:hypothetical protein